MSVRTSLLMALDTLYRYLCALSVGDMSPEHRAVALEKYAEFRAAVIIGFRTHDAEGGVSERV